MYIDEFLYNVRTGAAIQAIAAWFIPCHVLYLKKKPSYTRSMSRCRTLKLDPLLPHPIPVAKRALIL